MKIIYLLPPSESKNDLWIFFKEDTTFNLKKPFEIIQKLTPKDLKCFDNRFLEAINLNKNIEKWPFNYAISRYNWIMYKNIDYINLSQKWQKYFDKNFLILSWMYGILKPKDIIWNYKLPVESIWISTFWKKIITELISNINCDYVVDLLPLSYKKMIDFKSLPQKIIQINFIEKNSTKKVSHGVKNIKWQYIKYLCENNPKKLSDFKNYKIDNVDIEILNLSK